MENVKNKFIYPSTQLVSLLHPMVLKVYMYLLGWQNLKSFKIYTNKISNILKLKETEVEVSIQTLIDNKLIQVNYNDGFEVEFNREELLKYFQIPIGEVSEMELLQVSNEVTWNKKQTSSTDALEDMSDDKLKLLILRLQATLEERKQVKELVKSSTETKDLPF